MNTRRLVVLVLAALAAGIVALVARGLFGGGTQPAAAKPAPQIAVSEVLVASGHIQPGQPITADEVRWQQWPAANVDPSFVLKSAGQSLDAAVAGTVARAPIVAGEPITYAKIVKSQSAGFMAATLGPGMRAVAIGVSVASVAGGFILPNDRVDIIVTVVTGDSPRRGTARTVLSNVRVLAIDQAAEGKAQKAVSDVKTVTLELTPQQVQVVALAQAMGTLSLSLRSLGDNEAVASAGGARREAGRDDAAPENESGFVAIIRYGMSHRQAGGGGQ